MTTDIAPYAGGQAEAYQARMIMTPEDAKALDDQVRKCTQAVLREGTDYGHIPGTNGEEKSLWRPGAQKLLQWFRLECICERVEVERDDDGRKHGITYRAEVGRGLKTANPVILATCEGSADYDESKFHQSEEQVRARLRDQEHKWAAKDRRVPNADRWNSAREYRADWNALMKRAQKRAIVGAVVDATAAGGIFSDREEDDSPAPAQDDGPTWYEQALEDALTFTDEESGRKLYVDAAHAARDGQCTPRQANHVQNRIQQRVNLLKKAAPVDVEDLARQASDGTARRETAAAGDHTRSQRADRDQTPRTAADENGADPDSAAAGAAPSRVPQPLPPLPGEDQPGSVSPAQLTKLHTVLTKLGFNGEDREHKLVIAEVITGHTPLTGPEPGRSSKNLSLNEARKLIDTLDGFGGDRDKLIAYMAKREQAGDSDG
jgi:hypothetical protein